MSSPAADAPSSAPGQTAPIASRRTSRGIVAARWALPVILIAFVIVFSILRPDTFATTDNFKTILTQQAVLGLLALGAMLPLVVGEFDLSVGANLGVASILVASLTGNHHKPMLMAILIALAVSSSVGLLNGVLVARIGINAFVATLAMGTLLSGLVLWGTNGNVVQRVPASLTDIGQKSLLGIPLPVVYVIVVALIIGYVLRFTPVGRYLYALGGSKEAARLSGLNVTRLTLGTFVAAGLLAGLAGVLLAAKLGSATPTSGPDFLLPAFAACFLGATAIRPGSFNVTGTVTAVLTIAVGTTGLELMGVPFYIEPIFSGVVLLVAALATRYLQKEQV
jgi:ribose transport system permease protein